MGAGASLRGAVQCGPVPVSGGRRSCCCSQSLSSSGAAAGGRRRSGRLGSGRRGRCGGWGAARLSQSWTGSEAGPGSEAGSGYCGTSVQPDQLIVAVELQRVVVQLCEREDAGGPAAVAWRPARHLQASDAAMARRQPHLSRTASPGGRACPARTCCSRGGVGAAAGSRWQPAEGGSMQRRQLARAAARLQQPAVAHAKFQAMFSPLWWPAAADGEEQRLASLGRQPRTAEPAPAQRGSRRT